MSAFIVNEHCLNAAVSFIYDFAKASSYSGAADLALGQGRYAGLPLRIIENATTTHVVDSPDGAGIQQLAQAMHRLNCAAYEQRYQEPTEADNLYRFRYCSGRSFEFGWKQLNCFLYQCSEGNVPDSLLYRALKDILWRAAEYHMENHNARYKAAPWECTALDVAYHRSPDAPAAGAVR